MARSELVDIEVFIRHRTEKAILVDHPGSNTDNVWLPLSQIEVGDEGDALVEITLPRRLAEEKGLA